MLKLLATNINQINLAPASGDQFYNLGQVTFPGIIGALVKMAVVIAALVFFFMLIIGGIRWIASGGDKAKTEEARNQITAALVGLVIVFAAWAIVALINAFFKVNILNLTIPTSL